VRLATSDGHVEQAFRVGAKAYGLQFHVEINPGLAEVIADQMPAGSLPADAVSEAESWGGGVLDRLLALG
jgi:GMP synthase (glutamine-hydrolysing)